MGTITYDRDKDPKINSTGIPITGEAREDPNALVAIATGAGTFFEVAISGDADTVGTAILQLFRVKMTLNLQQADPGAMSLTVEVTPVNGDATDADASKKTQQVVHPQTMDAWQTDAGFPPVA